MCPADLITGWVCPTHASGPQVLEAPCHLPSLCGRQLILVLATLVTLVRTQPMATREERFRGWGKRYAKRKNLDTAKTEISGPETKNKISLGPDWVAQLVRVLS